jgi:lipopolysaccharide transport system ATP-binding protein
MSQPIIRIEKLGKRYVIRHQRQKAGSGLLSEQIAATLRKPFQREAKSSAEEFWALRDVSLDVDRGEVVGIIGRNGAGKSTLLKILSRITDPSEGRVRLRGRVASLLEVGTGFHPELTGRENIFLNGAILGMSRAEIRRKFDEIVAFSEVEKFLDTPVKRYSSGMYVRLAFSVAAHLEPEILIVDEVLAVGDAAFQQKCLGKMQGITRTEGRTVLFVSHNMSTIRELCQRVCLLRGGQVHIVGTADEAIGHYLSDAVTTRKVSLESWNDRRTTGEGKILSVELQPGTDGDEALVHMGGSFTVRLQAEIREPLVDPVFGVLIHDALGTPLIDLRSIHHGLRTGRLHGAVNLEMTVNGLGLYPGRYFVSPWITDSACKRDVDFPRLCCTFDVRPAATETDLQLNPDWGKYFVPSTWTLL